MPARDGQYLPYASGWATAAWSYSGCVDSQNSDHDWALLALDKPYGTALGFMGRLTAASGDALYRNGLHTAGYPADKGSDQL